MYESGYYPPGAEHDPRAPYNEPEHHYVKCDACDGKGYHWYAYNFITDDEDECTEEEWLALPEHRYQAISNESELIRGLKETCDVCDGTGEVEYEEDFEPDYDDYYER